MRARTVVIVVLLASGLLAIASVLLQDEVFDADHLIARRTVSNADESRVDVHARLVSGMKFVHRVHAARKGDVVVLSITALSCSSLARAARRHLIRRLMYHVMCQRSASHPVIA